MTPNGFPNGLSDGAPLGVLTAMPDEARALIACVEDVVSCVEHGGREYIRGSLWGRPAVVVVARCGKVAAATTATELIVRFGVGAVVCSGVAGGLGAAVEIGDVVIADRLIQHDLDARPLWPRHVVPLLETGEFHCDAEMVQALESAAKHFEETGGGGRVHRGLIASGDQFIHGPTMGDAVRRALPETLCVEMEGAAVAQVCCEYGIPFAVFRAISDRADSTAAADFGVSLGSFAATHTVGILSHALGGPAERA